MSLEVKNLVKKYKDGFCANDDISFSVRGGEVFGILVINRWKEKE